ncbi:MAG: RNA 2'-phosphotransferase, partial [Bacteroidetes bacterium]
MKNNIRKISKQMSYVLRHNPDAFGLSLDAQGWCKVSDLLAAFKEKGTPITREYLEEVVDTNDKKRFAFSEDGKMIRASQGHSIRIDLGYTPEVPPEILYHGTAKRNLDSIFKEGLQKRNRHHVHLSPDLDTAIKVGQRHGKVVVPKVKAKEMHVLGFEFYRSQNGVWL